MSDLISRQAAIDAMVNELSYLPITTEKAYEIAEVLNDLPSAQPEQQWIPCSERLPEVSYDYLGNWSSPEVILLMNDEEYIRVCNGHFNPIGAFEVFEYDGLAFVGRPVEDVFAWMTLPEPYREVDE